VVKRERGCAGHLAAIYREQSRFAAEWLRRLAVSGEVSNSGGKGRAWQLHPDRVLADEFSSGPTSRGLDQCDHHPTIAYGKGYKNFDAQGPFGFSLPAGNTPAVGPRSIIEQYLSAPHSEKIRPETELNITH
jgi:hypothetical protein